MICQNFLSKIKIPKLLFTVYEERNEIKFIMTIEIYKLIHYVGIIILMMSFGSMLMQYTKKAAMSHGIGLLLILVSGFGMQARMDLGFPTWLIVKLVIWLLFGACIVLIKRKVVSGAVAWGLIITLGALAAYIASFKMLPFTNTALF